LEKILHQKITGMLIDLDVLEISEIFEFLEDAELLKERINEAKELIESENQEDKWSCSCYIFFHFCK